MAVKGLMAERVLILGEGMERALKGEGGGGGGKEILF